MAQEKTKKVVLRRDVRVNTGQKDKDGMPIMEVHKAGSTKEYPRLFANELIAMQKASEYSSEAEKQVKEEQKAKAENEEHLKALASGKKEGK